MTFSEKNYTLFNWIPVVLIILSLWFIECKYSKMNTDQVDRWAKHGLQYVKMNICRRASYPVGSGCERFKHTEQSRVAVHVSEPGSGKVIAILPDSEFESLQASNRNRYSAGPIPANDKRSQHVPMSPAAHDAVLVLDPSPGDNFGHTVVLFYVDYNVTTKKCEHRNGLFTGRECLSVAVKDRCQNQLRRHWSHAAHQGRWDHMHRAAAERERSVRALRNRPHCEIHFLPLVVRVGDSSQTQRLHCVDLLGFAQCPVQLTHYSHDESVASCELRENTRRCHRKPLHPHAACGLYQTCDHAVLLSGGWRAQITHTRHANNLHLFYQMLRNNGFQRSHIRVFFAGSRQALVSLAGLEAAAGMVQPATEKLVIREHISYVCRKRLCADSLFLYLNSPACHDGSMLLWDRNHNGIAEQKERYLVDELLADLAGCRASRILLFVDQSYSTSIHKRLNGSSKHRNVVLFGAAPWMDMADIWASLQPTHCLLDYLNQVFPPPHPVSLAAGLLNTTLAGAPCNVMPPLSEAELRKEHMGCQNLPTAIWHRTQRQHEEEGN